MRRDLYQRVFYVFVVLTALISVGCERVASLNRATGLHNEGVSHYHDSDYHLALRPLKVSFELRKKHLGPVAADTVNTAQFLLTCLDCNGDDQVGFDIAKDYLVEIEQLSGKESHEYAEIETILGSLQADLGDFDQAIKLLRHAKDVYVTHNGETHEDSFLAMHNLNLVLARAGFTEEAIAGEEQLLAYRRQVLGDEHRETIKSMTNLAFALSKRGDFERAKDLHEESFQLRRKVFGEDHPETYVQLINLGISYNRLGQPEEGIEMCRGGYEFFLKHYPEGHPDIRWAALNLRNLLSFTEDNEEREMLTEKHNLD